MAHVESLFVWRVSLEADAGRERHSSQSEHVSILQLSAFQWHQLAHFGGAQFPRKPCSGNSSSWSEAGACLSAWWLTGSGNVVSLGDSHLLIRSGNTSYPYLGGAQSPTRSVR